MPLLSYTATPTGKR
uniref:Uncharacterized protein n=1 Tax=Anguilla anguilla TaxID=7936 RepID=A0A0E9PNR7_ANGAN